MFELAHDAAARPHAGQFFDIRAFLGPDGGADPQSQARIAAAAEEFAVAPALDHVGQIAEGDAPQVFMRQPEGAEGEIQQVAPVSRPGLGTG